MSKLKKILGITLTLGIAFIADKSVNAKTNISSNTLEVDKTLAECYDPEDMLTGDVAVISRINSLNDLEKLNDTIATPSTVILNVDKNMNVLDSNGNSVGKDFKETYDNYLKGKIIPSLYIKDMPTADSFLEYCKTKLNLSDMAVISNDSKIVKYIRENNPIIRGIVDWSNTTLTEENWYSAIATTNSSYAQTLIISKKDATYEAIRYIQARFKTVWVLNDSYNTIDIMEQINNGAYGIICDDYENTFNVFSKYNYKFNVSLYNRMSYNVAHRGLCLSNYENSLEGYIEAYEKGATHIETDIHLTKDGKIVIMHDDTIDRTTNGQGTISNMTYSEISKYKITKNYNGKVMGKGVNVPLLSDVLEYFKDKDIVLVIEIKESNYDFVEKFKEVIEEYEMQNQIVVISFNLEPLKAMRDVFPDIPTANLNTFNDSSDISTLCQLNCGVDTGAGNTSKSLTRKLALRGYSSWYWTYNDSSDILKGMQAGVLGLTNNSADSLSSTAIRLVTDKKYFVVYDYNDSGVIDLNIETFEKIIENDNYELELIELEEHNDYAYAIYCMRYKVNSNYSVIYSQKIKLVSANAYISVEKMQEILSKNSKELTKEDITYLNKMENAYQLLSEDEQELIDISKVSILLDEYNNKKSSGCGGSIVSSLCSVFALLNCCVLFGVLNKKHRNI